MRRTEEKLREEKIEQDILASCYTSEDQIRAWHDYLQETLSFPFEAIWNSSKEDINAKVRVIDITSFYECKQEKDMLVEADYDGDIQSISLFDIIKPDSDERTKDAIKDWQYWVNSGNRFEDDDY